MARTTNLRDCYTSGYSFYIEKLGASSINKYIAKKVSFSGMSTPKQLSKLPKSQVHKDYKDIAGMVKELPPKVQRNVLGIIASNHTT